LKILEDDLKDLRAKNKAEEGQLREKNNRGEDFLKEIITGYDEMMESKEKEILDLEVIYSEMGRVLNKIFLD